MNKVTNPIDVSFLIPTYNAAQYLDKCLQSIRNLDYPAAKIEIIVADGGSTDNTLEIAKKYNSIILHNSKKTAEFGKKIAFDHSRGTYVVLLDSDNIIASSDWLKKLLTPLNDSSIIGVESEYLIHENFTSINKYANALIIVDPLARMLASKPHKIANETDYHLKVYRKHQNIVAGANGFIWRKSSIAAYLKSAKELNETSLLATLASKNPVKIAFIPGVGIYHYYCQNLSDYVKKRKKIAHKHLVRSHTGNSWVQRVDKIKIIYSILFLLTVIGPLIEATINSIKDKKLFWFWHPIICFVTIYIYIYSTLFFKLGNSIEGVKI